MQWVVITLNFFAVSQTTCLITAQELNQIVIILDNHLALTHWSLNLYRDVHEKLKKIMAQMSQIDARKSDKRKNTFFTQKIVFFIRLLHTNCALSDCYTQNRHKKWVQSCIIKLIVVTNVDVVQRWVNNPFFHLLEMSSLLWKNALIFLINSIHNTTAISHVPGIKKYQYARQPFYNV